MADISVMEALKIVTESIKAWADDDKVEKVSGKDLSTNDYTTEEKNKVANIANDLIVIDKKIYLSKDGKPVSSGVELPDDVKVDTTLSVSGTAADAKTTGDAINELNTKIADLLYEEIKIESFSISPYKAEIGATVDTVEFSWALNKVPATQKINDDIVDITATSYTMDNLNLRFDNNKSFSLVVTDEREASATKHVSILFANGVYHGVVDSGATIDNDVILALNKMIQNTKNMNFTLTAGENQRIIYALPSDYGTPVFTVGGLDGGFHLESTINFTNASGYEEPYDVWLSDNVGLGKTTVKVS